MSCLCLEGTLKQFEIRNHGFKIIFTVFKTGITENEMKWIEINTTQIAHSFFLIFNDLNIALIKQTFVTYVFV